MLNRNRKLRIGVLVAISAACIALAGCGGGSGDPNATQLLQETFCGNHNVSSGKLNVALTIVPSGSRTLKGPISLSLSGAFQKQGQGKLPESDLTIALSALGNSISAGVISTGGHGYVTLAGSNYHLPQASYQRLASSFSAFASPPGCGSKAVSQLNIHPLHWLTNPQVVGTETVGGASTTHIHAGINVQALLADLGPLLKKAPSLGLSGTSGLSASTLAGIASQIQNANFDVWTGTNDKTLRKLTINLKLPVSGQISTLLGGLNSAAIGVTMEYSDLGQPQTITAPTNLQPYNQLQTKLAALFAAIRSQLIGVISGGLTGGSSSSGSGSTGASGSNLQKYSACIQAAAGNMAKIQKCAPLLSGK